MPLLAGVSRCLAEGSWKRQVLIKSKLLAGKGRGIHFHYCPCHALDTCCAPDKPRGSRDTGTKGLVTWRYVG